jgi:hypothetical protein
MAVTMRLAVLTSDFFPTRCCCVECSYGVVKDNVDRVINRVDDERNRRQSTKRRTPRPDCR